MLTADIDPDLPDKVRLEAPQRLNDLIKTLPGAKFGSRRGPGGTRLEQAWRAPLTWQLCLAMRTTFDQELEIGPSLREWATAYRDTIVRPALALRMETEAELPGFENLFGYQRAGVKFMATTKRALLTDSMGAGKTVTGISTLRYLHEQGEDVFPALIVAPSSTLLSWEREIHKWWPGHTVNVVKGTATQRRKSLESEADFFIINWEGLRFHSRLAPYGNVALKLCVECGGEDPKIKPAACQKHEKELNAIDFKSAIGDEIHRAKNGAAASTRALKSATANTPIKIAMSGTPIANHHGDLWSPLNWLLPEAYPAKTEFVERFMEMSYNPWGGQEIIGLKRHMETEFFAGVDPHLRHMPKEYVLPFLPPKVYERRDVEMGAKQAKAYKQMAEKMLAELDDENVLRATSPLQQSTRLLQLASTYGSVETWTEMVFNEETGGEEPRIRQKLILEDPSCKLDAFMDDFEDFGDESIVVFTVARQLADMLAKRLEKQEIKHGMIVGGMTDTDKQQVMDDFQDGKLKVVIVTVQAGGTGVTLTRGSIAVFLQRPTSLVNSKQAEDRVHRIGSEMHEVVRYIDYVTKNTFEELIFPLLDKKDDSLEKVLRSKEALRTMLIDNVLPEEITE